MKRLFLALLMSAFFMSSAQAQGCLAVDDAVAVIEGNGGVFIDLVTMPENSTIQVLSAIRGGNFIVGVFINGCAVTPPIEIFKLPAKVDA